jgi:Protein of unknown function (DUF3455)
VKKIRELFLALAALSILLAGCASYSGNALVAPPVPDQLRPQKSEKVAVVAFARGVQIYECQRGQGDSGRLGWIFKEPEADLFDAKGTRIGRHFSGPIWESTDGSKVLGELKQQSEAANPRSIPWLLLTAKTNLGTGIFSHVTSIQRVKTIGGKAPSESCEKSGLGERIRVPYVATYYFYTQKE